MNTEITVYQEPRNLSPYQQVMAKSPDIINDDFFGEGGINFKTVFDIINPLQHLPVISSIYREITGDTISAGARLAGGALFGGGIGLLAAIANEISNESTGHDIPSNMFAMVSTNYQNTSNLA